MLRLIPFHVLLDLNLLVHFRQRVLVVKIQISELLSELHVSLMKFVTDLGIGDLVANSASNEAQLCHLLRVNLLTDQGQIVTESEWQACQSMGSSHERNHASAALIQLKKAVFGAKGHVEHGQHVSPCSLAGSRHIGENRFVELSQKNGDGSHLVEVGFVLCQSLIVDSC